MNFFNSKRWGLCAVLSVLVLAGWPIGAKANDYELNFSVMTDFEKIRSLVDKCSDLGILEKNRRQIEAVSDLEDLRSFFEQVRVATVRRCPAGISGKGIKMLKSPTDSIGKYNDR